jgi:hypothetical protein
VLGRARRQTEGLIGSIIHLLGIELAVPDHSTLGGRAQTVTLPKWTRRPVGPVCAENLIRVGGVRESAILAA